MSLRRHPVVLLKTKKDCVWNFFGAGGLYLPALGYSNAGGRPRWVHPPATRRVSELERPQCNCPVLGPFLYGDAPKTRSFLSPREVLLCHQAVGNSPSIIYAPNAFNTGRRNMPLFFTYASYCHSV